MQEFFHVKEDVDPILLFRNLHFQEGVLIDKITGNNQLTFENCTFKKPVELTGFQNVEITLLNCVFFDDLRILGCTTNSIKINKVKFHTTFVCNDSKTYHLSICY